MIYKYMIYTSLPLLNYFDPRWTQNLCPCLSNSLYFNNSYSSNKIVLVLQVLLKQNKFIMETTKLKTDICILI